MRTQLAGDHPVEPHLGAPARRTGFSILFVACLAKAVVPGAVNFAQQAHPLPGTEFGYQFTPLAGQVSSMLSVVIVLVCLALLVRVRRWRLSGGVLLYLVFAGLTQARMTPDWLDTRGLSTLLLLALVGLTAASISPTRQEFSVVGGGAAVVAAWSLVFALLMPANAQFLIAGSGADGTKAFFGSYVLAGPLTHSNTLGIFVVLGMPFLGLLRSKGVRRLASILCLVAIVLSASRTALIALAAWALFRILERLIRNFRSRAFRGLIVAAVFLLVVALPLVLDDRDALSTRVGLWRDSLSAWSASQQYVLGLGPLWETTGLASAAPRTTSAHNLFVQWTVSGGLLLLFMGVWVLVRALKVAVAQDRLQARPSFTAYLIVLLVISATEYVLPPTVSSQLFPVSGFVLLSMFAIATPKSSKPGA